MPARFGGDVATAALLAPQSGNGTGLVLPLGDSQYQCGELANYRAAGAGYYQYFVVLNTTCTVVPGWLQRRPAHLAEGRPRRGLGPGDGDDGHAGVPTIVVGTGAAR